MRFLNIPMAVVLLSGVVGLSACSSMGGGGASAASGSNASAHASAPPEKLPDGQMSAAPDSLNEK
jgi:hypothetical protein